MATVTKEKVFEYSGADRRGNNTKGEIRAINSAAAKALLNKQGIIAKKVRPKAKPLFGASNKVTPQDIALFTRQLSTMMRAGVPLIQSFEIVAEGSDSPGVKELMSDVRDTVAGGESFANAIRKHPKYFDDLYCELIAAGGDAIEGPFDGEEAITLMADLDAGASGSMTSGLIPDLIGPVIRSYLAGDRQAALQGYNRILPIINHENRQCGFRGTKAALVAGGIIKSDFCRHPIPPLHDDTRAALLELLKMEDPLILRWGQ